MDISICVCNRGLIWCNSSSGICLLFTWCNSPTTLCRSWCHIYYINSSVQRKLYSSSYMLFIICVNNSTTNHKKWEKPELSTLKYLVQLPQCISLINWKMLANVLPRKIWARNIYTRQYKTQRIMLLFLKKVALVSVSNWQLH